MQRRSSYTSLAEAAAADNETKREGKEAPAAVSKADVEKQESDSDSGSDDLVE